MTCKDCIHYDVCQFHIDEETEMTVAECSHFKYHYHFVDIVRCKDCKYGRYWEAKNRYSCILHYQLYMYGDHYCSHGVRKEQEDIDE
ncbi:MAG: hypothetical protein IJX57_04410 [Clostridia bacterium]|nr:hypothetical protein [Clostridia bacterium]